MSEKVNNEEVEVKTNTSMIQFETVGERANKARESSTKKDG